MGEISTLSVEANQDHPPPSLPPHQYQRDDESSSSNHNNKDDDSSSTVDGTGTGEVEVEVEMDDPQKEHPSSLSYYSTHSTGINHPGQEGSSAFEDTSRPAEEEAVP